MYSLRIGAVLIWMEGDDIHFEGIRVRAKSTVNALSLVRSLRRVNP